MAVAICHDKYGEVACLYDTTSGHAFGPVFEGPSAEDDAEGFLAWLTEVGPSITDLPRPVVGYGTDAREWLPDTLEDLVNRWRKMQDEPLAARLGVRPDPDDREPDGYRTSEGGRIVPTDR